MIIYIKQTPRQESPTTEELDTARCHGDKHPILNLSIKVNSGFAHWFVCGCRARDVLLFCDRQ